MSSRTPASRAQMTVRACTSTSDATVVPQEPAPTTATDATDGAEPTVGSIRWPMVSSRAGVAIPIRAFALGKARLAEHLADGERAEHARRWADRVADAAGALPVVIVSS